MKNTSFHDYNSKELNNQLLELKQALYNLRFDNAIGQLANGNKINSVRKDIAKVKTIIRERELGISEEPMAKKTKKAKKGE